ncbi:phosphohistidine phosphatase SixA [Alteromonas sp. ASW11-36]|uniref:Phosphohistidine phosphatase SixA n=1 Tax=Alteromonas arenosi TaxID=3055817 RepID=A0ABT7SWQ8_9ALTE|nr:phosphohistidine phosphatase SixA [Alteromonas sp. ASW11-36]MDM7859982.1 phosphohistidine phosphatase SixA [Alteromonas sp. ASW11-36]
MNGVGQSLTRIFILRHGEAEASLSNDKKRQLTKRGRNQVKQASVDMQPFMQNLHGFQLALVSPYVRTQQTFDLVAMQYGVEKRIDTNDVTPNSSARDAADLLLGYSLEQQPINNVLVVSHMPLVSFLTAELAHLELPPIFSTSAFAVIDIVAEAGSGELICLHHQHD